MIYHVSKKPMIVKDKVEMEFYVKDGWCKDYASYQEQNNVPGKIAYHESEIAKLKKELPKEPVKQEPVILVKKVTKAKRK